MILNAQSKMPNIKIHDLQFEPYLSEEVIKKRVTELGDQISADYSGRQPLLLAVLNGAFIFAADLSRSLKPLHEISFIKLSSYQGTSTSGVTKSLIGLNESLEGRDIIIVEGIVDTGNTIIYLHELLLTHQPASIAVAALLRKPEEYKHDLPIDYVGFDIPSRFVVGYGLDYDGLGRQLSSIYSLV